MGFGLTTALGSDLVAWNSGLNRGKSSHLRFVQRVFHPSEQRLISASSRPDFALWLLWAVKESAYKAVVRFSPDLVFSPVRFTVSLSSVRPFSGTVQVSDSTLVWLADEGESWVHVCACEHLEDLARAKRWVAPLEGEESAGVRALALRVLCDAGVPADRIEERPPVVFCGTQAVAVALSLSHDEGYGAVAWLGY